MRKLYPKMSATVWPKVLMRSYEQEGGAGHGLMAQYIEAIRTGNYSRLPADLVPDEKTQKVIAAKKYRAAELAPKIRSFVAEAYANGVGERSEEIGVRKFLEFAKKGG
jgi:hypothetical protein